MTDPVAWDVALRVARQAVRYASPLDPATQRRVEDDFAEATARAEGLVEEVTGLSSSKGPARARVMDRAGWVEVNVGSFRRLLRPVGERLAASATTRRALNPASRAAAGVEVGLVLSWMSGRVLGQYDMLGGDGDDDGDVVYYVGPNVVSLERRHGFPPQEFRLWIALHEVTHRLQFTGVPWMHEHFLGMVERGAALTTPDTKAILQSVRRAAAEVRAGNNPLADGGIIGLLATSEQLATLHEAQALMSLLEGHGDVVMARAGERQVPGAARFARVLKERRESASGVARAVQQMIGIEAKMRQYAEGERFIEEVTRAGGDELLALVWRSPEMLPTLEEIREPQRWVARVGGTQHAAV
ncbi:MAG TPA: zinc-dependent metalloprotease [Acidimicrobiales bacterium]|nr:zinc-dependent metalloprotease [Acidimicrobiales bacterium]